MFYARSLLLLLLLLWEQMERTHCWFYLYKCQMIYESRNPMEKL